MADWIITHTPAMLNQLWPKIQAAAAEEDITDSELPTSRQRIKKKAKAGKQKEPNLYNLSKQLERHTKQLSNIESTVQQFPQ
jgi:isoleucyl-tRNA synthetase